METKENRIQDFYPAMESFEKRQRNINQICTSQEFEKSFGKNELIECWLDKSTGKSISVVYSVDGTYRIIHLD